MSVSISRRGRLSEWKTKRGGTSESTRSRRPGPRGCPPVGEELVEVTWRVRGYLAEGVPEPGDSIKGTFNILCGRMLNVPFRFSESLLSLKWRSPSTLSPKGL